VTVKDIMTPMIFELEEDATVEEAADMMLKGRIHRVFVTRDKKLIGVVTTMDMLKVIRNQE
jgi:CBS domain-containing protein